MASTTQPGWVLTGTIVADHSVSRLNIIHSDERRARRRLDVFWVTSLLWTSCNDDAPTS